MANDSLIRALKANSKSLNLNSRNISELSKDLVKLTHVMGLSLRHNRLRAVPVGLQCVHQVGKLNKAEQSEPNTTSAYVFICLYVYSADRT